ncbi:MAG: (Fe-S)-binding protein [Elusimicrobia bacterium]|nr:(Fe-S)-binding protein [Elusimicrobiota bacterium]
MTEHIDLFKTDLGERGGYDAVSQCSRCGYCLQACPTYVLTGKEAFSARGRNQVVRMMMEGKIKDIASAEESLSTCLLCGACSSACYAHIPTLEFVLEGRRTIQKGKAHWLVRWAVWLLRDHPHSWSGMLKLAHFAKCLGISHFLASCGVFRLLGLQELAAADSHIEQAPLRFAQDHLRKKDKAEGQEVKPRWLYFASCGTNFLFPKVALASFRVLSQCQGKGRFMRNGCCGLLAYNYENVESAKTSAQKNIEQFEREKNSLPDRASMVADCSSCVAFLKNYDQLFLNDLDWKPRAQAFSQRVRDVIEVASPQTLTPRPSFIVTYHDSCRARNGQGIVLPPRDLLKNLLGDRYVELSEAEWCCGGAGAYSFVQPELSAEILRRKISNIASTRAELVLTSSTSCLLQLAYGLKKYYPDCRVMHLSEFLKEHGQ